MHLKNKSWQGAEQSRPLQFGTPLALMSVTLILPIGEICSSARSAMLAGEKLICEWK